MKRKRDIRERGGVWQEEVERLKETERGSGQKEVEGRENGSGEVREVNRGGERWNEGRERVR